MNELVQLVSQKTGLSEEMSRMVVETVLNYLKEKLPAPIAGQIDSVLGGSGAGSAVENLTKGLGRVFGKN